MKYKITYLTALFSLLFLPSVLCHATNRFVNPTTGSDFSGDGSYNNPYKTIDKVGSILYNTHCDTIYILGNYHTGVKDEIYRSDDQSYWIFIRPYNYPTVVLDGQGCIPDSWKAILGVQSSKYIDIKNISVTRNDSASGIRVVSDDTSHNRISQYINIRNCRVNNCRRQGILIQARDVLVENCEIDSVCLRNRFQAVGNGGWDFAIGTLPVPITRLPWCQNITFRSNYVHNVWGEGIVVERARNFIIEDNRVRECFSCCIYADNSRFGVIQRNWISINNDYYNRYYDANYIARANGVFWASENVYHQDSIVQNIDICNNFIFGTGPAFGWFDDIPNSSIYDSYRKINIYFNTVFNTKSYQIFYLDTVDVNPNRILPDSCNFINNIICKPKWQNQYERYFTYSSDFDTATHRWAIKNNCFIHGPDSRFVNNITGPPSFLDSNINSPDSFKISATSNCISHGIKINSFLTDYWNSIRLDTPCIGMHEFGGIPSNYINIPTEIPTEILLFQNYPNPFNPSTKIRFTIPFNKSNNKRQMTKLTVYDIRGREVEVLISNYLMSGTYEISFYGATLASGIYFYTLKTEDFVRSKRMLLIK